MDFDLLLKNGWIVDGVEQKRYQGDIAVIGDTIVAIGEIASDSAKQIIDVQGSFICPGLIDVHSHSDISLLANGRAQGKIAQGITTEILGNCGYSPFPLNQDEASRTARRKQLNFIDVEQIPWSWSTFEEYKTRLQQAEPSVNIGLLLGYGSARSYVVGNKEKLSAKEQSAILSIVEDILEQGALGVSTGLAYPPDCFSSFDELVQVGKIVAHHKKVFAFHIRSDRKGLMDSIEEATEIGRLTGASVQISHIKAPSVINHGRSVEMLRLLQKYQKEGVDITADCYPYTAGSTTLSILFPKSLLRYSPDQLYRELKVDSFLQDAVEKLASDSGILYESNGENIVISSSFSHPEYVGKNLAQIACEKGRNLAETVLYLFVEDFGKTEIIIHAQDPKDLMNFLESEDCFIGTDGIALNEDDGIRLAPHPRYFGTFPQVFEMLGAERVELFVKKACVFPSRKFHLERRGVLQCGNIADIAVLSPHQYGTQASFRSPKKYAQGVEWVIVNGKVSYQNCQVIAANGKIL